MGHHDVESTCDGINLIPCKIVSRDGVNKANSTKQEIRFFDKRFRSMRSTSIFLTQRCYLLKVWGFGSPKEKSDPSRHARTTSQSNVFKHVWLHTKQIIISRAKTNLLDVSIFVFKLLFFQLSSFQASSIFVFVDGGIGARRHKLSSCHNPISACMESVATVNSQPDFLKPNSPDLTFTLSASNWALPTHC